MALYPSTLFHMTTRENLFSILSSGFRLSYAREKIEVNFKIHDYAVPMVSFSDLRLSELAVNNKYGYFGIGMSKEWAIMNKLNPVLYVNNESNFSEQFFDGIVRFSNSLKKETKDLIDKTDYFHKILDTLRYIKNYRGPLERKCVEVEQMYTFANEREWRYVPLFNDIDLLNYAILNGEYLCKDGNKEKINKIIENKILKFTPKDINYLVVKSEDDIISIVQHLENTKGDLYDRSDIIRLTTKILTYDNILKDS